MSYPLRFVCVRARSLHRMEVLVQLGTGRGIFWNYLEDSNGNVFGACCRLPKQTMFDV